MAIANSDHESLALQHRGGVLLERYDIDLHLHPSLGFALARNHRSAIVNTDNEGFRHSDSPFGTVDTSSWLADGGGLVLGNSTSFGLAADSDGGTTASHLAALTGVRQLNLGVVAGNSLQELVAALPFLHAASTVVVFSGASDYWTMMATRTPDGIFGPVFFEGTFASLSRVPMFQLAAFLAGAPLPERRSDEAEAAPPAPDFADAEHRVQTAARQQLRHLAALTRLVAPGTPLLFALQPFATPRTRDIDPEEQAHFDFEEPIFGRKENSVYEEYWDLFAVLVREGCAELGVPFVNLSADRFTGYCFGDQFHLNDEGGRQAARMIHQELLELPAPDRGTAATA
ncbi:hypothetical protein [Streptacidiphilus sp. PAMC 29251]